MIEDISTCISRLDVAYIYCTVCILGLLNLVVITMKSRQATVQDTVVAFRSIDRPDA